MEYKSIQISKTANYAIAGNKESKTLVLALHGYGQLVKYFIRKFQVLEDNYLVLAPEGLHYFYTQGFAGRVGASWMTKENRETEIQDYLHYLETLVKHVKKEYPLLEELIVLGFSQGTATASRFFAATQNHVKQLVLWSGLPAHDIPLEDLRKRVLAMANGDMQLIQGETDAMRPDKIYKEALETFTENEIPFTETWYAGGHAIDSTVLKKVLG